MTSNHPSWQGNALHFHRSGVDGQMCVTDSEIRLQLTLGFLLKPFKGKFIHHIEGCDASRDNWVVMMPFVFRASLLLCECHRPFHFPRPATAPTTTAKRELSLANAMRKLDAGNRNRRVRE